MSKLDKLLLIKNTQCYFDDYSVDRDKFEKLKKQIESSLKLERLVKKIINKKENDLGSWYNRGCHNLLQTLLDDSRKTGSREGSA